jgi:2-C-methyl-D-erythritol 4-phosphate cytidylyltransferase
MTVAAIVPAAGRGERLGAATPKALVTVAGVTLLGHAVAGLRAAGVDLVVVAAPEDMLAAVTSVISDAVVVGGGATRQDSVRNALAVLPEAVDVVLVHDAARAFTPPDVARRVIDAVRAGADAVIPVLPVTDTVKQVHLDESVARTLDRSMLRAVQTPQGFRRTTLDRAHAAGVTATDDAGLAEALGVRVQTVTGAPEAFKVTTPFDLAVAEALVTGRGATDLGATSRGAHV